MLTEQQKATNYDTFRHIERVRNLLNVCAIELIQRGEQHDQSKLASPEVEYFTEYTPKLATCTYGSDEYKGFLAAIKPALDHHYANNRHHPEFQRISEEWRPVIGFEDSYEVSSFGNIRSIERIVERANNQGDILKKSQPIKQYVTPKGYLRLQLSQKGKQKNLMCHRIVAEAFIDNPDQKPQINHKDGDKKNNRVTNLEWVTGSENLQHAYDNDLKKPLIKYVIECTSMGITAFGCEEMATLLRQAGVVRASASGVWNAINGGNHLDLDLVASQFETHVNSPVNDMNLIDIMEMLCDWKASSERHNDGNIRKSIEISANRFGLSPQMVKILENTADLLFK